MSPRLRRALRPMVRALSATATVIGTTILFLLALELALGFLADVRKEVPAGAPRAAEPLLKQARFRWRPYVQWRHEPIESPGLSIDSSGVRRTWRAPSRPGGETPVRVFMMGGSTMWGSGVDDDETLPSQVAKALAEGEQPIDVDITNWGEEGWVSRQSMIQLELELERGDLPQVVVFYDGINDIFSALLNLEAGLPQNEERRRREFNLSSVNRKWDVFALAATRLNITQALGRAMKFFAPSPYRPDLQPLARVNSDLAGYFQGVDLAQHPELPRAIVEAYRDNVEHVRKLAAAYGFNVMFYWQPTIFDKPELAPSEVSELETFAFLGPFYAKVGERVTVLQNSQAIPRFRDLRDLFHGRPGRVFIDYCHLTGEGNAIVGREIARDLRPVLESVLDAR